MVDAMRKAGSAPASIQNTLDPLRVPIRRAIRADELAVNPLYGVDVPARDGKRDRVETPEHVAKLIAAAPAGDRFSWAGAFYAGLRSGELRALRWCGVSSVVGLSRGLSRRGSAGRASPVGMGTAKAAGQGFEPRFPRPERGVLPLHHPAGRASRIAKTVGGIVPVQPRN